MSYVLPRTGTFWMRRPCLPGASSTSSTGRPICLGFLLQMLTAYAPASPAPTIITGRASPRPPGMRSLEHTRQNMRMPPMAMVPISAIRISTPRNRPRFMNWLAASVMTQATPLSRHSLAVSRTPA